MKFAIVDGNKIEAIKGAKGVCPLCSSELIAKCGEFKINHWAHKGIRNCDPWWEPKTEWHREWKGNFPIDWQESIQFDSSTNEKHIADVRTDKGLVIEFQHSYINPEERRQRENFYKNMIWIVDGARLERDFPRFLKAKERNDFFRIKPKIFRIEFADECFPKNWLESSVPVIIDFKGTDSIDKVQNSRTLLYCIFPIQDGMFGAVFAEISRNALIKSIINGEWQTRYANFMNDWIEGNKRKEEAAKLELEKQQEAARIAFNQKFIFGRKYTGWKGRF
ncbi:MAG: hypothetical protein BroJett042_32570 [Bacteroidota bacterium]|nr:MAG: hypothetical protein BroJett042_32570 [Bacteroidota bacterium]